MNFLPDSISIIVAAYNEERNIRRRIENLCELDYANVPFEIIIVSDGSSDNTVQIVKQIQNDKHFIKLVELKNNSGKAIALNHGITAAAGEIIIFADSRQLFQHDTILQLVAPFQNSKIGAVSGHLAFGNLDGVNTTSQSIGAYWLYETFIRINEAKIDSVIGCPGAIYAVRKKLVITMPARLILDDMWIPMHVILQGYKVKYAKLAIAWDSAQENIKNEFSRKVRTLAGNFQLFTANPKLLSPIHNRLWWMLYSHKVFRLIVPYILALIFILNIFLLSTESMVYNAIFILQIFVYFLSVVGYLLTKSKSNLKCKVCNFLYLFINLNIAAVMGLYYFLTSKETILWKKTA